jgi:four helix bundle protein
LEILEAISYASLVKKEEKIKRLQIASINLDFLKILFRLTYELRIIDQKKYLLLEEKLQEIGKMLGGWIRSLTQIENSR